MINSIALEEIRAAAAAALEEVAPIIATVGATPEVGFEEKTACALQVEYLKKNNYTVLENAADLATAFRADIEPVAGNDKDVPSVGLLTEYDALPAPSGHACGHQLIMGAGLLAQSAVCALMLKYSIPGKVSVLGCPAEEEHGGKVYMLREGIFKDVDIALLSHPFFRTGVTRNILAVMRYDVEFFGRSAHASTAPEQGINALDAMTVFMNGINAWRQQLPSTSRVHGIITRGGTAANVIPDYTAAFFYVRSDNNDYQEVMVKRFEDIAHGAALITGCDYKVTPQTVPYSAGKPNAALAKAAEDIQEAMGLDPELVIKEPLSTDFANVCDEVPGVNIYFNVTKGEPLALHSLAFREAAAKPEALEATVDAAVVMAKIALDYLTDAEFRKQVKA